MMFLVHLAVFWLILVFGLVPSAHGETRFWLSEQGIPPGSPPPVAGSTPDLMRPVGATDLQIFVWVQPDPGQTLENLSLNLVSSDPDVLSFSAVEVHNSLDTAATRFEFIFDTTTGLNSDPLLQTPCPFELDAPVETALWGIKGFNVGDSSVGIGPGSIGIDPRFDAAHNTWLLATVTFEVVQLGQTDLYLQIGEIGMNLAGGTSSELNVVFGDPDDAALNAKTDRCQESDTHEARITGAAPLLGDFNFNGILDAGDVDLLSAKVIAATHSPFFDLDGDALVDVSDRSVWVEVLAGTSFGDADLNGAVEFADFLVLSANFGLPGGWADGDFDGNANVAFSDFLMLSSNFGIAGATATATAVPEPRLQLLLVTLWPLGSLRRRRLSSCRD